jgi:hypothetical protein
MNDPRRHLSSRLRAELDGLGVDWRVANGSKHLKIFVGDRLLGVYPRGRVNDGPRQFKKCATS